MKRTALILILLISAISLAACSRGEGGAAGYGAGGGQSLREGSTSPLHSPIAQDRDYQALLGMNILLYPPPVDDPKFEPYGAAYWDMDPSEFTAAMREAFTGEMGEQAVYEPEVAALQDHPFIAEIQETLYDGAAIQVGWIYGNNANLDYLEMNDAVVTLIPVEDVVVFVGLEADLDQTAWTFDTTSADAFYVPSDSVIAFDLNVLHSAPLRTKDETGQLTAVIVPAGMGLEAASPGEGKDQALVANGRWVFAGPDLSDLYQGLTGDSESIVAID